MAAQSSFFGRSYSNLVRIASLLQSPLLLAVRLYWGWQFIGTGSGKLRHLDKTTEFFQSLHIAMPHLSACVASATECCGGLLLLVGLGARLVSIPLIFTMIIAYVTAESEALRKIFSDPDKFVTATPFLFMLACFIVLAFGPGVFSLDWIIEKTAGKKAKGAA